MKAGNRQTSSGWQAVFKPVFITAVFILMVGCAECYWCTKLESYTTMRVITQNFKCNQSYEVSCGWFTSEQCTYYETVDCPREVKVPITRYRMAEKCCPGYKLDPINNITCILITDIDDLQKVTTAAQNRVMIAGENSDLNRVTFSKEDNIVSSPGFKDGDVEDSTAGRSHEDTSDFAFLNLSSGAYAGIISGMLFLLCLVVLVSFHFWKRQRRLHDKMTQESIGMSASQKMLSSPSHA